MTIDDIDLIEINEAFASVVAAGGASWSPTWTASTSTAARSRSAPARLDRRPPDTTLLHELERLARRPAQDDVLRRRFGHGNPDPEGLNPSTDSRPRGPAWCRPSSLLRRRRPRRRRRRRGDHRRPRSSPARTTSFRPTRSARAPTRRSRPRPSSASGSTRTTSASLRRGRSCFCRGGRPSDARVRRFGGEVVIPTLREQLADLRAPTPPARTTTCRDLRSRRARNRAAGGRSGAVQRQRHRQAGADGGAPARARIRILQLQAHTPDRDRSERLRPRADQGRSEDRQADQERGPIDPETDRRGSRLDPYQALARAICGQQLSTKAARSIWEKACRVRRKTPSSKQVLDADPQSCVSGPLLVQGLLLPRPGRAREDGARPRTPSPARR